jgi:GTP-binding protein YchF
MQIGLTGYPRSGKTTLFLALAPGAAPGKDVTFGNIKVPDKRVATLSEHFAPKKSTYAEITFVDIAGIPGATAKALEPRTIAAMRNVDALVHVVRAFEDPASAKALDPERDAAEFDDELVFADLEVVDKRVQRIRKENKQDIERQALERAYEALQANKPLRELDFSADELKAMSGYSLVSRLPLITLWNLGEKQWSDGHFARFREPASRGPKQASLGLCGQLEMELAALPEAEQGEFLEALGLSEPARYAFIRTAYGLLDLIAFLTSGPDECRAWTVRRGASAPEAAGKIHSDLQRGFIRAEVISWDDWTKHGSEAACKAAGALRVEGKGYVVQDGDILHIRSGV